MMNFFIANYVRLMVTLNIVIHVSIFSLCSTQSSSALGLIVINVYHYTNQLQEGIEFLDGSIAYLVVNRPRGTSVSQQENVIRSVMD